MQDLIRKFNAFRKRKFVKLGVPFFLLVLGGSFYLEQFAKLKFQFGKQTTFINPEELRKEGVDMKNYGEVTLESEYEKIKELDIDNWQQVRIPRPWNENSN